MFSLVQSSHGATLRGLKPITFAALPAPFAGCPASGYFSCILKPGAKAGAGAAACGCWCCSCGAGGGTSSLVGNGSTTGFVFSCLFFSTLLLYTRFDFLSCSFVGIKNPCSTNPNRYLGATEASARWLNEHICNNVSGLMYKFWRITPRKRRSLS